MAIRGYVLLFFALGRGARPSIVAAKCKRIWQALWNIFVNPVSRRTKGDIPTLSCLVGCFEAESIG